MSWENGEWTEPRRMEDSRGLRRCQIIGPCQHLSENPNAVQSSFSAEPCPDLSWCPIVHVQLRSEPFFNTFCSWPASLNRSLKNWLKVMEHCNGGDAAGAQAWLGLVLKPFLELHCDTLESSFVFPSILSEFTRWGKIESCSDTSLQSRNQQCLWDTCLRPAWAWTGLSCYIHNISLTVWSAEQRWVRFSSIQAHGLASMKNGMNGWSNRL